MFFFEKKNQKTFENSGTTLATARLPFAKVFCFFFSKKKILLAYAKAKAAGCRVKSSGKWRKALITG
jgi:hypothetical protein